VSKLKIAALDAAWWVLLPIAWPAWAVVCLYSGLANRRTELAAQLGRETTAPCATCGSPS
jgi:hypothetical protein